MSSIFGGGGGQTVQTQSSQAPWAPTQPYLQDIFARGQGLASQPAQSPFTIQAQQMAAQRAMDPNSLVGRAQGTLGNTISGQYLNPNSNPYFMSGLNDTLGLVKSQFAGQYGGPAGANLGNSGYQEALARGLGGVAANAYSNLYNTERANQMNALGMAPSLDYAQAQALGQVGAQQTQAPWTQLQNYQGAISGAGGSQGTNQTPYYTNALANAMGLGLGGMGIYGMGQKAGLWGGASAALPALAPASESAGLAAALFNPEAWMFAL